MVKKAVRQRDKYQPAPLPSDACQCTRATAAKPSLGELTHLFPYRDKDGARMFSRFRYLATVDGVQDKTFRYCQHYDRTNPEHVAALYGLPRVREAILRRISRMYLVEGEPDCEATWALQDEYATTTHLGTRFPLEAAEHFRGYAGIVYIVVDKDHLDSEHKERFAKGFDYPGAAAALRKWRALKEVGVKAFFREAIKGKDMRDHLEVGKTVSQLRKVTLETIKERAPKESASKSSVTMKLSAGDLPEGPGMRRFIAALEAKGFYLEKIGPTRYKTNCPHPDHDDRNPSFEFEQGIKPKVVGTCESGQCTWGPLEDKNKGWKDICSFLGLPFAALQDDWEPKGKPKPPRPDDAEAQYAPDASDPMQVARHIQDEWTSTEDESVGIMYVNGDTWVHTGTHWEVVQDGPLRARLYQRMDREYTLKLKGEEWVPARWAPAPAKIGALLEGVRALNVAHELHDVNTWTAPPEFPTIHVSMANGILDIERGEMRPHTPRYFNTWSLPFDYDPDATCPDWEAFLEDIFEGDPDSVRALRQFMGYLVSGRSDLEKILALIGPTRSGKGTIADAIDAMMGPSSVESFTLKHLAGEFGLQNLVGKSVMIAADSRSAMKAEDMQTAIERLLSISANDKLVINRKNQRPLSMKLGVRPIIMSNELPAFMDSSNAINKRMVILRMRKSFLGREDHTLKRRVMAEVQGIFNWALRGLEDLNESGSLLQPQSAQNYIESLDEGASPHQQFLEMYCEVGAPGDETFWCYHPELVQLWKSYCEAQDMKPGNPNWLPRKFGPIVTQMGGDLGKGFYTDEKGNNFRTMTGIRIKQDTSSGPKEKVTTL